MPRRIAEWEKQESVWLCYPSHLQHWGENLEPIRSFVLNLVRLITDFQAVNLIFNDKEDLKKVEKEFVSTTFPLHCHQFRHNDIWIRDFGPHFMNSGKKLSVLKFGFNAWGGKFPPFDLDESIPRQIGDFLKLDFEEVPLIIEGGALEFNGEGLALSTLPCLIGESRNPDLELHEMKEMICSALNLEDLFVFSEGLKGDHTDGHIDNVARFIAPKTLMLASTVKDDPQFQVCERLHSECQELQKRYPDLKIIHVPLPKSKFHQSEILSRSYLNFIFVNGAMIVPIFNEQDDKTILNLFQNHVRDRQVIGVDCGELVLEGGGLHCMTCHQPFQVIS